jgi:hypothetical protein
VGGSGKQSLARFAAYVADCDLHTVSMSAGYNLARFRQEVKHVMKVRHTTRSKVLEVAYVYEGVGAATGGLYMTWQREVC